MDYKQYNKNHTCCVEQPAILSNMVYASEALREKEKNLINRIEIFKTSQTTDYNEFVRFQKEQMTNYIFYSNRDLFNDHENSSYQKDLDEFKKKQNSSAILKKKELEKELVSFHESISKEVRLLCLKIHAFLL